MEDRFSLFSFVLYQGGRNKQCVSIAGSGFKTGFQKIRHFKNIDTGHRTVSTSDMSRDLRFTVTV